MNKSLYFRLITCAIIAIMSSCGLPYCKKVPFTDADLAWLNAYAEGDTILFSCNSTGSVDTMIVTEAFISNPPNTSIFDLRGCNWLEDNNEIIAVAWYNFDIHHNGEIFDGGFSLKKKCHKKSASYDVYIFGKGKRDNYSKTKPDTINNTGLLVVNDSILQNLPHRKALPLKEIRWNRDKGLIGYQIGDTEYTIKE